MLIYNLLLLADCAFFAINQLILQEEFLKNKIGVFCARSVRLRLAHVLDLNKIIDIYERNLIEQIELYLYFQGFATTDAVKNYTH